MDISNRTLAGVAAALLLSISIHQCYLCRNTHPACASNEPTDTQPIPQPVVLEEIQAAAPIPQYEPQAGEVAVVVDPYESPAVRERMMDEQVRRMQEYALEAGPDDPFSKTPEQIEEFRKRGNPIVW